MIWCMKWRDCQQIDLNSSGLIPDLIMNIKRFLVIPTSKHKSLLSLQLITLCNFFHLIHHFLHSKQYQSVFGLCRTIVCINLVCRTLCIPVDLFTFKIKSESNRVEPRSLCWQSCHFLHQIKPNSRGYQEARGFRIHPHTAEKRGT